MHVTSHVRRTLLLGAAVVAAATMALPIPGRSEVGKGEARTGISGAAPSRVVAGTVFAAAGYNAPWVVSRVTLPGRREALVLGVVNLSRLPATAWLRFWGECYDRESQQIRFGLAPFQISLPPNPAPPNQPLSPFAQRIYVRALTVPRGCRHDELRYQAGGADGAFWVSFRTRRRPASEYGANLAPWHIGRPFTRANARWNLGLWAGRRGSNYQAHHTLPVKFEARFRVVGLNIHHPDHLRWWCAKSGVPTNHQSNADQYNARWGRWLRNHPRATQAQILDFRDWLSRQYTYRCPR